MNEDIDIVHEGYKKNKDSKNTKVEIDRDVANTIYTYLWYMLAHEDDNITFRYIPPEYRDRKKLNNAMHSVMWEINRVDDLNE